MPSLVHWWFSFQPSVLAGPRDRCVPALGHLAGWRQDGPGGWDVRRVHDRGERKSLASLNSEEVSFVITHALRSRA